MSIISRIYALHQTTTTMKYFNRHAHMDAQTRREILKLSIECKNWSVGNMLSGLFDGFNYADDIREACVSESPELQVRIGIVCATIDTYPVSNYDVTEH